MTEFIARRAEVSPETLERIADEMEAIANRWDALYDRTRIDGESLVVAAAEELGLKFTDLSSSQVNALSDIEGVLEGRYLDEGEDNE